MNILEIFQIPTYEFRLVFGRTKIEYDPDKESKNRKKHRYSLESAVYILEKLLLNPRNSSLHAVSDTFIESKEVRQMHMCVDDEGKVLLMVTTMRNDETVRVISFRRAHPTEREKFSQITGFIELR